MPESVDNVFVHSHDLERFEYPKSSPFKTTRAKEVRRMLLSMGLLGQSDRIQVAPEKADTDTLLLYHTPAYLDALQQINEGQYDMDMLNMGLGTGDCPAFRGVYDYSCLAAGATVTAAKYILQNRAVIAFNPSGGYHHAFPDRAGGFCYINDVVLACMVMANAGRRIVFVDIDVHHCDGVQSAFYERSDVMTISLHQDGRTLLPGTGFVDEIGTGEGTGYSVNIPLPIGTYDEAYMQAFRAIVLPLLHNFSPDVIVLEAGADTLAGDPLAGLSLTNNSLADAINLLLAFGKPILAVGGGGYNIENTVRAWALVWSALCGDQAQDDFTAGMGGVMLENMEWQGGAGLRDRILIPSQQQCQAVLPVVESVIAQIRHTVFPLHGLSRSVRNEGTA
jgi:acetoin utilization protein AcuC